MKPSLLSSSHEHEVLKMVNVRCASMRRQQFPVNGNSSYTTGTILTTGAQWLSGRVVDSRPSGRRFEVRVQRSGIDTIKYHTRCGP